MISHYVLVDCLQLFSSRLSHSQLDVRSTAWLSLWIATSLSLPVVPTAVISLCTDWEQNPLTPTFTAKFPSTPALLLAQIHEFCVLCLLPLVGLFTSCLPWYCQLYGDELLSCL
ncbi:hypothetical protein DPMN_016852 [Dreissena polymorpha]|uniref:Uncharacterized protein n=1 Tax=Dreissena polymorpha TaxID=45954 RepID=A0A9D4S6T0_DREPO|nr:hypothetical protein DPMN_016852 [Dreissena polymorpha]